MNDTPSNPHDKRPRCRVCRRPYPLRASVTVCKPCDEKARAAAEALFARGRAHLEMIAKAMRGAA